MTYHTMYNLGNAAGCLSYGGFWSVESSRAKHGIGGLDIRFGKLATHKSRHGQPTSGKKRKGDGYVFFVWGSLFQMRPEEELEE